MGRTYSKLIMAMLALIATLAVVAGIRPLMTAQVSPTPRSTYVGDDADENMDFILKMEDEWTTVGQGGFLGQYRLHNPQAGNRNWRYGRWTFYDIENGEYDLYATWPAASGLSGKIDYKVKQYPYFGISQMIFSVSGKGQAIGPQGSAFQGAVWEKINTDPIIVGHGQKIRIYLLARAEEKFVADAVRLVLRTQAPVCGDGVFEGNEECEDDGDCDSGEVCEQCECEEAAFCGDGVVDAGEECDDGNQINGDGCTDRCTIEQADNSIGLPQGAIVADNDGHTLYLSKQDAAEFLSTVIEVGCSDPDPVGGTRPCPPDYSRNPWETYEGGYNGSYAVGESRSNEYGAFAAWRFPWIPLGVYGFYITWPSGGGTHSGNLVMKERGREILSMLVDQSIQSVGPAWGGALWKRVGFVSIGEGDAGEVEVTLSVLPGDGEAFADALALIPWTGTPPTGVPREPLPEDHMIVDYGDDALAREKYDYGFNGSSQQKEGVATHWNFQVESGGEYDVYITYPEYLSYRNDLPWPAESVYFDLEYTAKVTAQTLFSGSFHPVALGTHGLQDVKWYEGIPWKKLGSASLQAGQYFRLSVSPANQPPPPSAYKVPYVADAVMLVPTGAVPQLCGNGVVDPGEECDDGNTGGDDGCSPECREEGDCSQCIGVVCAANEMCYQNTEDQSTACDVPGLTRGLWTQCGQCGNGRVERNEDCDDGNMINNDGCSNTCEIDYPLPSEIQVENTSTYPDGSPLPTCSWVGGSPKQVEVGRFRIMNTGTEPVGINRLQFSVDAQHVYITPAVQIGEGSNTWSCDISLPQQNSS